ncbi:MAG: NAD-dependent epimerase/dehydratase family protein [Myxococcota bacterium]
MTAPLFDPGLIGPVCLVTGGSGYLGRHLVLRLVETGCNVRSLDLAPGPPGSSGDSIVGDVRLYSDVRAACEGVDTVFHTVALIRLLARYRLEERLDVFEVNVVGTEHVIRACRAAGVSRLVYTSSFNVAMGKPVCGGDESTPLIGSGDLLDLYSETKMLAERAVLVADGVDGLRTVALRPGGIWGPGDDGMMLRAFIEQLAMGRFTALVGDGSARLDNTHVDNAVDAHLLAAAKLTETPEVVGGQPYFVTDAEPMNGLEWFRPLVEGLGQRWPSRRIPAAIVFLVANVLEWLHFFGRPEPPLTRRGVLNISRDGFFRIDRAREQLGYEPRVRAAEGIPAILPDARRLFDRLASARSGSAR